MRHGWLAGGACRRRALEAVLGGWVRSLGGRQSRKTWLEGCLACSKGWSRVMCIAGGGAWAGSTQSTHSTAAAHKETLLLQLLLPVQTPAGSVLQDSRCFLPA